jgi:hypothetical protein
MALRVKLSNQVEDEPLDPTDYEHRHDYHYVVILDFTSRAHHTYVPPRIQAEQEAPDGSPGSLPEHASVCAGGR